MASVYNVTVGFNTSSGQPDISSEWDEFIVQKLMKHDQWVSEFDTWNHPNKGWGAFTTSKPITFTSEMAENLSKIMTANGFEVRKTNGGKEIMFVTGYNARPPREARDAKGKKVGMLGNANDEVPFQDHNQRDYDPERDYNKNDPTTLDKLLAYLSKDRVFR
ncbi:uncharacterized protein PV07_12756 [Cladophialophora immunda]|uniref:Uncharacterized protein n=1 Tax=Cladophialophora immunda TaxID=569365 RepID=A0A0D1Z2B6_9EURO|nr:uncharacterized protein PV07_12756 [Cladophialophora immunda]KIW21821.1 hypothetical protein PV07_12756 [Cladophialophora immunda]